MYLYTYTYRPIDVSSFIVCIGYKFRHYIRIYVVFDSYSYYKYKKCYTFL